MATKIISQGDTLIQYLPHTHSGSSSAQGACYPTQSTTEVPCSGTINYVDTSPCLYQDCIGCVYGPDGNPTAEWIASHPDEYAESQRNGKIYYIYTCSLGHSSWTTYTPLTLGQSCPETSTVTAWVKNCDATTVDGVLVKGDLSIKDYEGSDGNYYISITPENMFSDSSISSIQLVSSTATLTPTKSGSSYIFEIPANGVYQLIATYSDRGTARTDNSTSYEIDDCITIGKIYVGNKRVLRIYLGSTRMKKTAIGSNIL